MKKEYKDYEPYDFLNESSFLEWIKDENEESIAFWENWIKRHPEKLKTVMKAREQFDLLTSFEKTFPPYDEYKEVWKGIEEGIDEQVQLTAIRTHIRRWSAIAAAVLFLLGGWFVYKQFNISHDKWIIVKAEKTKKRIMLADSSVVVLNTGSSLKYNKEDEREVWLSGQALFKVKHTKTGKRDAVPFRVHVGKENITVLGTSFTVKKIGEVARVILLNGRVRASVGENNVIMAPGEKLEWINGQFKTERVNAKLYLAWETGEFHFDHTSLMELSDLIKDYYGYDLEIKNKATLQARTISGTITSKDEETLWKTLAIMFHVRLEKRGSKIIITPYK